VPLVPGQSQEEPAGQTPSLSFSRAMLTQGLFAVQVEVMGSAPVSTLAHRKKSKNEREKGQTSAYTPTPRGRRYTEQSHRGQVAIAVFAVWS